MHGIESRRNLWIPLFPWIHGLEVVQWGDPHITGTVNHEINAHRFAHVMVSGSWTVKSSSVRMTTKVKSSLTRMNFN